ncbi:MAG: hypothetical protein RIR70_1817 [Pseudomonadota bacterium]
MSLPVWLREDAEGISLSLHIQPGAKATEIVGLHGQALKIRLAAPPVEGRANEALIDFIATCLGVPRSTVRLTSGASSRAKRLKVSGLGAACVFEKLTPRAQA